MGARLVRAFGSLANPGSLCSGSVLGRPLKRSRSPGEDPEDIQLILGSPVREDPEAQPVIGEGHEGSVEAVTTLAYRVKYSAGCGNFTRGWLRLGDESGVARCPA